MVIYHLLLFSIIICGFLCEFEPVFKRYKLQIWYMNILFMILVAGLRADSVGTDTASYKRIFYSFESTGWSDILSGNVSSIIARARGYAVVDKIVYMIFGNYNVLLLIIAAVTYLLIAYFIRQNTEHIFSALAIFVLGFFYCNSLNANRQYFAISGALYSYCLMRQGKRFKSIVVFLIALYIHTAVLGMAFALVLEWKDIPARLKRVLAVVTAAGCLALGIFWDKLLSVIVRYFSIYSFLDSVELQQQGRSVYLYLFYFAFWLLGVYAAYFIRMDEDRRKHLINLLLYSGIGIVASIAASKIYVLTRIIYVYRMFVIVTVPESIGFFNKRSRPILTAAAMAVLYIPFLILLVEGVADSVVPYSFFWQ